MAGWRIGRGTPCPVQRDEDAGQRANQKFHQGVGDVSRQQRAGGEARQRAGQEAQERIAVPRLAERVKRDDILRHQDRQDDGGTLQRGHDECHRGQGHHAEPREAALGQAEHHDSRNGGEVEGDVGHHLAGEHVLRARMCFLAMLLPVLARPKS